MHIKLLMYILRIIKYKYINTGDFYLNTYTINK
jgi:hypothetical protein